MDPLIASRLNELHAVAKLQDLLPHLVVGSNTCPYCNRSSFYLYGKGSGWCFSTKCPSNGKVIDIVHHYRWVHNLWGKGSFYQALSELEEQYNLSTRAQQLDIKVSILEDALSIYQSILYSGDGVPALNYLRSRGWSDATIKQAGIGYAPHTHTLSPYGLNVEDLERAGLQANGKDYMGKRVIFPIRDTRGKIMHLTGRYLYEIPLDANGDPLIPKWKHTKGMGLSSIAPYLVGEEYLPRYKSVPNPYLYLTEGYPDTLSLHNIGLPAVGTLGLQGLLNHYHKLQGVEEIVAMYDCDVHGDDHPHHPGEYKSWRVVIPQLIELQILLPTTNIYICMTPSEGTHLITGNVFTSKDINEYCVGRGCNGRSFTAMVEERKVLLTTYLITKYGYDLSWHRKLTQLVAATGRGLELLQSYIPTSMSQVEYAIAVWGA